MEFMFGEMISRFEDRFENWRLRSKVGQEKGYGNELYETWPMRGRIQPNRDSRHRQGFDDLGDVDQNLGSIKLKIPTFKRKN